MIPLAVPDLSGKEAAYLQECVDSTFVSSVGPFVDRFQEMVAVAAGNKKGVATSAGTTGLHLALSALGVGRDDLVILPSFTFIASANAIAHCGAMPWLFDISAETWTLDPDLLREELASQVEKLGDRVVHRASGRRIAAMLPVHMLGMPADMDPLVKIAREWEIPIVADAAAALGATYKGRKVGETGADLSVFSFNGNKTVTAGGGGMVTGDSPELMDLVRHLSTTARRGSDYVHDRVGFNYRMTNLQAAVGCAQMERLEVFLGAKRRIRKTYDDAFRSLPGIGLFPAPAFSESACWFAGITVDGLDRPPVGEIQGRLRQAGIDARSFWMPMHLQPPYAASPRTAMPVADGLWRRVLTLPCSTGLSAVDQVRVIDAVRAALGA